MEILTQDHEMKEIIQLAQTVASSKATVLIQGESGTGKELVAHLIHDHSARSCCPLVAINCAAIPENLLESELFGYERGAFTGAVTSKPGKFENAHRGTLLLDEISEMDIRLQAKLLRVIQEGQVDRIGGKNPISVDVRLIATTNRNLSHCVQDGRFREDLYYRINVVHLTLPPLRQRQHDIELLTENLLKYFFEKNNRVFQGISDGVIELLKDHHWPGNVRELENILERAALTSQTGFIQRKDIVIERQELQKKDQASASESSMFRSDWMPGKTLNDLERDVIIKALKFHRGNRTHTANALGISIRTLRNKISDLKKIGIYV